MGHLIRAGCSQRVSGQVGDIRLRGGRNNLGIKNSMCKAKELRTDGILSNRRVEHRVRGAKVVREEAEGL